MEVIATLAERVLVFNQGHVIASGQPVEVMNDPQVIEEHLGRRGTAKRDAREASP